MMKSQSSIIERNIDAINGKAYLEFAVHLLDQGCFSPMVFSHDNGWFDRKKYAQVVIGFTNLLLFLDSCGITIETEVIVADEMEAELYRQIMRDEDLSGIIKSYELTNVDFTDYNMENAVIPEMCTAADFGLVKAYLQLKAGAALNRSAFEKIFDRRFTDSETMSIRKQLSTISCREIVRRHDNSYEMR
ncbi:MAG: hypothetical protein II885_17750 [Oscillospiraceae bacterium]|nr:hypothetical protein [Oscillospiraceae bacterium]